MYKKEFAQQLRELQKRSGVRQKEIAEILGLSDASVSQFMHGVSLPRMEQFAKMLDLMNIPAAEAGKLKFQLMVARAGSEMYEPGKMPVHTAPASTPAPAPAKSDKKLEFSLWNSGCVDFFVSEDINAVLPGMPVIALSDMDMFDGTVPLEKYARNRSDRVMPYRATDLPGTILILTDGDILGLPQCGAFRIVAAEAREGSSSSLELFGFENDSFRIMPGRENKSGHWDALFPAIEYDEKDVRWKLPLLEVNISPICEKIPAPPEK